MLKTSGLRVGIGRLGMRGAAFFGRVTTTRRDVASFLARPVAFVIRRLDKAVRGLAFCLRATTFGAFRARALLAGERLVAGFKRVDLPAKTRLRDDVDDE